MAPPAVLAVMLGWLLAACAPIEPPQMMEARGDQCVEPTDVMRRNHMKFLLHERDQAVLHGVRNERHSLTGCIDCHIAEGARYSEPDRHFCASCHTFNAVRMDCFQCHADQPSPEAIRQATHFHAPAPDLASAVLGDQPAPSGESIPASETARP